jgi:hypothetical protein
MSNPNDSHEIPKAAIVFYEQDAVGDIAREARILGSITTATVDNNELRFGTAIAVPVASLKSDLETPLFEALNEHDISTDPGVLKDRHINTVSASYDRRANQKVVAMVTKLAGYDSVTYGRLDMFKPTNWSYREGSFDAQVRPNHYLYQPDALAELAIRAQAVRGIKAGAGVLRAMLAERAVEISSTQPIAIEHATLGVNAKPQLKLIPGASETFARYATYLDVTHQITSPELTAEIRQEMQRADREASQFSMKHYEEVGDSNLSVDGVYLNGGMEPDYRRANQLINQADPLNDPEWRNKIR